MGLYSFYFYLKKVNLLFYVEKRYCSKGGYGYKKIEKMLDLKKTSCTPSYMYIAFVVLCSECYAPFM